MKFEKNGPGATEEKSFKSMNKRTTEGWTDGWMTDSKLSQ